MKSAIVRHCKVRQVIVTTASVRTAIVANAAVMTFRYYPNLMIEF
jgi:hypothetical protein